MKKFLKLLFLMVLLSAITYSKEKIVIGTTAEYPPFEYLENGKIVGYDVDVINEIANKLDLEIIWKDMNFDGLISALQFNKIDVVIAGISSTPEREKVVIFSIPYHKSRIAFLMNKSNPMSMENLSGKSYGVDLGTTNETTARKIKNSKVITFSSTAGTLLALKNKKVDCIIIDEVVANNYVKNNPELEIFGYENGEDKVIAFNKNNKKLKDSFNKVLFELDKTGVLKMLQNKYGI